MPCLSVWIRACATGNIQSNTSILWKAPTHDNHQPPNLVNQHSKKKKRKKRKEKKLKRKKEKERNF